MGPRNTMVISSSTNVTEIYDGSHVSIRTGTKKIKDAFQRALLTCRLPPRRESTLPRPSPSRQNHRRRPPLPAARSRPAGSRASAGFNRACSGSANRKRLCTRPERAMCEGKGGRQARGHSRTHHSLQTRQSKVKMATIIAQQLSAGCVPFRDAPSPRARRGATRAAFPRPSTGPVCHRCACSALAAAREAGARASGFSRPSAAARARIDRRSEHGPAAPTDHASRTIRD